MSRSLTVLTLKVLAFALVMAILTTFLFFIFGQYRTGSTQPYSAVFVDASRLKAGDSVRVAGIRVGTVRDVHLQKDRTALVRFDTDDAVALTTGTSLAVRYLNLVGDRYLEILDDRPGNNHVLAAGARIPIDHTAPALDLDLLLGGLKPVIQGLNPQDVNALTNSLIQAFQGQGDTLESLLSKTSSFSSTLADHNDLIEQLIDNLKTALGTLTHAQGDFAATIDRLETLITGLSADRDPIGRAITSLDNGTASLASLLSDVRHPLKGTVDQLNRLAPLIADDQDRIDKAIQKMPDNYRKLQRFGAYGAFVQYYICGVTVRVSDLQGRTAEFPWIKQETGRCGEPNA
jgi:phospholipid/cholesterol/gamma-HCH transport system substrate-binding protein